jgi:Uncharacterized conserved protein
MKDTGNDRLFSLDILRGLDMVLLTVVGPLFYAINSTWELPKSVMAQFRHAWGGFTLWDIIMPLFIFMSGASVPFALSRRMDGGHAGWRYWRHVLIRVALLWVLGMVAQGRLLSMDPLCISPFNNTLQTIACGYLAAAIVMLIPSRRIRIAIPILLATAYTLILHFGGDYTQNGNAAILFERWFVPFVTPNGSQVLKLADSGYTWWATIPMFAAMGLCGMEATEILCSDNLPMRRFAYLAALGAALLAVGWALVPWIPSIKHIFTLTFTAQAMGWSCLLFAVLYWLTDIMRFRRGTWLLVLFGQTALLAYMSKELFRSAFSAFGKEFVPGAVHLFGPNAKPLAIWLASTILLVIVLTIRRRARYGACAAK